MLSITLTLTAADPSLIELLVIANWCNWLCWGGRDATLIIIKIFIKGGPKRFCLLGSMDINK